MHEKCYVSVELGYVCVRVEGLSKASGKPDRVQTYVGPRMKPYYKHPIFRVGTGRGANSGLPRYEATTVPLGHPGALYIHTYIHTYIYIYIAPGWLCGTVVAS